MNARGLPVSLAAAIVATLRRDPDPSRHILADDAGEPCGTHHGGFPCGCAFTTSGAAGIQRAIHRHKLREEAAEAFRKFTTPKKRK